MNVALDDFQGELGPLVVQSWESTSIKDVGFLIVKACLDVDDAPSARI